MFKRKGPDGRQITIYGKPTNGPALARQKKINTYNFPFTLNTATGCVFECRYCYLQAGFFAKHSKFGEEMILKENILPKLKRELRKYRALPQHLRRVQIGPATEVYHPYVVQAAQDQPDSGLMSNVLRVLLFEQDAGYPWAVHLVTKSPLIEKDIDLLKRLVCFQAEITITTISEEGKRQWEGNSPSVSRRFETIKRLSDQGLFVRVMAMPLFPKPEVVAEIKDKMAGADPADVADAIERARWADGQAIWERARECGAVAFKAKGLNYFDAGQLNEKGEPAKKVKGRNEDPHKEMLIYSGEILRHPDGSERNVEVETWWYEPGERILPDGTSKQVKKMFHQGVRPMPIMDFGYSLMDRAKGLDWGDCVGRTDNDEPPTARFSSSVRGESPPVEKRHAQRRFVVPHQCRQCNRFPVLAAEQEESITCPHCGTSYLARARESSSRERFPEESYPFSDDLCLFMDDHPEFLASLKIDNPRFFFLPQMILSSQPVDEPQADDEVIGVFYLDQLHLREGKKPLYKQDFIVNRGRRGTEFVSYSASQENGPYVRPIKEFFRIYGRDGKYYHREGNKPWQHHYDTVDDLPEEVQDVARKTVDAVSPVLKRDRARIDYTLHLQSRERSSAQFLR